MSIHKMLILDFGSQYAELIARRVRELGVYSELHPFDVSETFIRDFNPCGIILSGGPETVTLENTPRAPEIIFKLGCPILGICYGMQTMAQQCGGRVSPGDKHEFGATRVTLLNTENLFAGLDKEISVWMSHGDSVTQLPPGFIALAKTPSTPIAAMMDAKRNWYGIQFHPEVTHTPDGKKMLQHFVIDICQAKPEWTPQEMVAELVADIQKTVGKDRVLLALSGGVDSSVLAALLKKAIGDQLHCIFVDHGLLRLNEAEQVVKTFTDLQIPIQKVDAAEEFFAALKNKTDPEAKRKAVGETFIRVFERESKRLCALRHCEESRRLDAAIQAVCLDGSPRADGARDDQAVQWLAQGTIYPDVIESAGTKNGKSHVIKSHHNVGGLPERMQLKLLEPLRRLFKDEVRALGKLLGLPDALLQRHPFPGPGLSVRILGEVKPEFVSILQKADAIFIEELRKSGWYLKTSQAFAVFLPVKSVGVKGDARCYEYVVALRAVETTDFMTAHWSHLPYELISAISERILNEVRDVARVVYDVSNKPPATIEWE